MTDDDVYYPEYRAGQKVGPKAAGIGTVGVMAGLAQLSRTGAPLWLLLGLPVLLIVFFFLVRLAMRRSWTRTGAEYVEAGTAFGVHRTAWRDIQAIEIVDTPGAATNGDAPAQTVVVYDGTGRRTTLPHLDSDSVFALDEEVHGLRMLWERLRGDDWTRLPEVTASIVKSRRTARLARTWTIGIVVTAGAFMGGCILFLILMLAGVLDPEDGTFTAFMVVPPVLAVAGMIVHTVISRRRDKEREKENERENENGKQDGSGNAAEGSDADAGPGSGPAGDGSRGQVPGQGPADRRTSPPRPGNRPGRHT